MHQSSEPTDPYRYRYLAEESVARGPPMLSPAMCCSRSAGRSSVVDLPFINTRKDTYLNLGDQTDSNLKQGGGWGRNKYCETVGSANSPKIRAAYIRANSDSRCGSWARTISNIRGEADPCEPCVHESLYYFPTTRLPFASIKLSFGRLQTSISYRYDLRNLWYDVRSW